MIRYAIIADDLSGSSDTAVTLSNFGYKSIVLNYPEGLQYELNKYDAVSISTNSREIEQQDAKDIVKKVCSYLKQLGDTVIYKKIDSTWRGNIGAEIEAIMEEFALQNMIICSAYPQTGRIIKNGYLYVNDVPLNETAIAKDPCFPINDSYLPNILRQQTDIPVELITHEIVAQGADSLTEYLKKIVLKGKAIILVDAINEKDLETIVSVNKKMLPPLFFCGSAGLSQALFKVAGQQNQANIPPVLLVVGSVNPQNRAIVDYLGANNIASEVFLNPVYLLEEDVDDESLNKIAKVLDEGQNLVITTCRNAEDREKVKESCKVKGLKGGEGAYIIAQRLQKLAPLILNDYVLSGLIVTGGTTALHILRGLRSAGIELEEEVDTGVPYGKILGGPYENMSIITKAGGFGSEEVFAQAIQHIKRKYTREGN